MKKTVATSTLAEMQAIANAIWHGIQEGLITHQDELLLQTDCEAAIYALNRIRKVSQEERQVINWVYKILDNFSLKMQIRHVKGHSRYNSPRYAANKSCDRQAKQAMRQARDRIRIEGLKNILKGTKNAR